MRLAPMLRLARRHVAGRILPLAVASVLMAGCSQDVRVGLPRLPLDTAVTPLTNPVQITTVGWATSFREWCQDVVAREEGFRFGTNQQFTSNCVQTSGRPIDNGWWQIVVSGFAQPLQSASLGVQRSDSGEVRQVELYGPSVANFDASTRARAEELASTVLRNGWIARRFVRQGDVVNVSTPAQLPGVAQIVVACTIIGRAAVRNRDVLVGQCSGRNPARINSPDGRYVLNGDITTSGSIAIDVATGALVATSLEANLQGIVTGSGAAPRSFAAIARVASRVR